MERSGYDQGSSGGKRGRCSKRVRALESPLRSAVDDDVREIDELVPSPPSELGDPDSSKVVADEPATTAPTNVAPGFRMSRSLPPKKLTAVPAVPVIVPELTTVEPLEPVPNSTPVAPVINPASVTLLTAPMISGRP